MPEIHSLQLQPIIDRALEEDWGNGDWTTDLCVQKGTKAHASIIAKKPTLASCLEIAQAVFFRVDPGLNIKLRAKNGDPVGEKTLLMEIEGEARSILKAERVALNFLCRMCGVSHMTSRYVAKLKGFKAKLLDTRKTSPGLRLLEKWATSIGGARNHRLCLTDGVLVKENHIRAAGSITNAVNRLLESLPPTLKIEVEASTLDEVHEALDAGADLILLDNMSISEMKLAVRTVRGRVLLEASGNITLDNIADVAETGVDFISSSAIIHSAPWADLSLLFTVP
ncbi:MAG: carboxylating nicotinate-nucleotide diphosphorylase [Deltaproteobacteria bacterium]|nr:carboxylating nicotinate-nucleotide diphosphorylase [Deltaproteobacteria bacterium]